MSALGASFAEYIFKFIVYIAVACIGVFAGIKLKASKKAKNSDQE